MTINVYWACLEKEWQRDNAPEPVSKEFYNKNVHQLNSDNMSMNMCPFFNKNFENLFQIRSLYSYSFKINENKTVYSKNNDQDFFNKHILIRSVEKKCFSFFQRRIFFTDAKKGLDMTTYIFPYLEDNNITERCIPLVGELNIGKWFRPLEYPFYLKNKYNEFFVEEGEIYFYIKFNTKEKINFVQFYPTKKIKQYYNDCMSTNAYSKSDNYNFFYNNFKLKKLVLKEIKNNIL
jgi:hypothetical protein